MTVLLQNRTISMILMVPDVEVLIPSALNITEKLDRLDTDQSFTFFKHEQIDTTSSMPVYHGSIVRIEQHSDDQNASDLIVRVPNFHHRSLPLITISNDTSNNDDQPNDTDSKRQARIKRRAPICPITNGSINHSIPPVQLPSSDPSNTHDFDNINLSQRTANTNRLATGLRSLSRAFTHGCKTKRSSSINEITYPPALPDIEVMTEKLEVSISSKKPGKHHNSISTMPKLITPKILFIKRKHFKIKKNPSSSISNTSEPITPTSTIKTTHYEQVNKTQQNNNSPKIKTFFHENNIEQVADLDKETNTIEDDNEHESKQTASIKLNYEDDQQFSTISQFLSNNPLSSIDGDSLSTHRYSTISAIVSDIRAAIADTDTEDFPSSIEPSKIIVPTSTGVSFDFNDKIFSSKIDRPFHVQTSNLQPDISVIRVGMTDLTTGIDRILPGEKQSTEQIPSSTTNQLFKKDSYETFTESYEVDYQIDKIKEEIIDHPIKINLDPIEYKGLASRLSIQHDTPNQDNSLEYFEIPINNITRIKSRSVDDLSRINNDQITIDPHGSISLLSFSELSARHCTLRRSNSYNGFGIYVSTDMNIRREHFIRQVEQMSPGEQAGLKENDRILCINGTSVIDEDYTVVLQLIKYGLQTDTLHFDVIANDAYQQFKNEIDQIYQITKNDQDKSYQYES